MEPPECPVCLQAYDTSITVPRVLPCGHSACEACLAALPSRPALPDTIRCPACNQTVRLPRPLGPAALPKNIDLLRLFSPQSQPSNPNPKPKTSPPQEFIPLPWTHHLFDTWKDLIIPSDALAVSDGESIATITGPLGGRWCCRMNQKVNLLPVFMRPSRVQSNCFRFSHTARVMEAVSQLPDATRAELASLVQTSSRHMCKVYGVWMDPANVDSPLFLVCEMFDRQVSYAWDDVEEEMLTFGLLGLELCEVVMDFHSQGVVLGCLDLSSFCLDEFRHCILDMNSFLLTARRIREHVQVSRASDGGGDDTGLVKIQAFVSPEVFASLVHSAGAVSNCSYGSDVWSLACILAMILLGDELLGVELFEGFVRLISEVTPENFAEALTDQYHVWREKLVSKLEAHLHDTQFDSLLKILASCLNYDVRSRPPVSDIWHCIRCLLVKKRAEDMATLDILLPEENSLSCVILWNLCSSCKKADNVLARQKSGSSSDNITDVSLVGSRGDSLQQVEVAGDLIKGLQGGGFKSRTMNGHQDCVTRLAVGGGFLFSSSFDKTVNVWSVQDFSLVQSLRGHEHKVMAMVVLDASEPLCISGDSGSGIFVWSVDTSLGTEPLKKWYEHTDWRYSGVHSLATSGTEYLYSGSGDKSIKAWSLKDYSLSCTMTGHRSTVSSLAVADGILYSGSWDGTIRLWCLSDHSPLSILGDDIPGNSPPVLALSVYHNLLASSFENGCLKIWRNDVLARTMQIQNGAIFALHVDKNWLFTGGWDKVVSIQELLQTQLQVDVRPIASVTCDSLITSLLYCDGKLYVGFSNKEIKVYYGS